MSMNMGNSSKQGMMMDNQAKRSVPNNIAPTAGNGSLPTTINNNNIVIY
jgi:hypothetical protein